MLDQNTDRMWYVIGAVLVGAAIILIANGTLPQMFASVTDSFQNVSNEITEDMKWTMIDRDEVFVSPTGIEYKMTWYLNADDLNRYSEDGYVLGDVIDGYLYNRTGYYHLLSEPIEVNPGETYEVSSDTGTHYTRYVIYDASGKVVDAAHAGSPEELTVTMPAGAHTFRFSTDVHKNPSSKPYERTDLETLYIKKL